MLLLLFVLYSFAGMAMQPPHPPLSDYARSLSPGFGYLLLAAALFVVATGITLFMQRRRTKNARQAVDAAEELSAAQHLEVLKRVACDDVREINGHFKLILSRCLGGSMASLTAQEREVWWREEGGALGLELSDSLKKHLAQGEAHLFRGTAVPDDYHQRSIELAHRVIKSVDESVNQPESFSRQSHRGAGR